VHTMSLVDTASRKAVKLGAGLKPEA